MDKMGVQATGCLQAEKVQVFDGSGATVNDNLFKITGAVRVCRICAIVTTVIGAVDCDTLYLNLFPTGGAAVNITAPGGVDIKAAAVGSVIWKESDVAAALSLADNAAGAIVEEIAAATQLDRLCCVFMAVQETATETHIRSTYTTTMVPCTGEVTWYVEYEPIGDGALDPA